VTERARQAYEEWKQADARAREAEGRLARTWDEYFGSRKTPPTAELIQEVSQLRAVANDRLTAAMLMMGAARRGPDSDFGRDK
jgi:ferric-dicitrate binding protein FerR (iron transport regulator)